MITLSAADLARHIEHTLFKADATQLELENHCAEAREKSIFAVCVNGSRVELARTALDGSDVQVVALIGYPLGAGDADAKRYETEIAVDQGAQEIDFVINVGRLKDGDISYVLREMRDIVEAADERIVKVTLESHLLTRDEKVTACRLVLDCGAQFVCNSADFHAPAATAEEIQLLREAVGAEFGVKAAGGVRDVQTAMALLEAGATRIGTSAGPAIVGALPG